MICASIVTSSAVVGSSASSSAGSVIIAMAMPARWRMPPLNWCGYWSMRSLGVGNADPAHRLDRDPALFGTRMSGRR